MYPADAVCTSRGLSFRKKGQELSKCKLTCSSGPQECRQRRTGWRREIGSRCLFVLAPLAYDPPGFFRRPGNQTLLVRNKHFQSVGKSCTRQRAGTAPSLLCAKPRDNVRSTVVQSAERKSLTTQLRGLGCAKSAPARCGCSKALLAEPALQQSHSCRRTPECTLGPTSKQELHQILVAASHVQTMQCQATLPAIWHTVPSKTMRWLTLCR